MDSPARVVVRAPRLLTEHVGTTTVVLQPDTGRYTKLNASAGVIWARLEERATEDELAETLCARFRIARDRALADVRQVLHELSARDLVTFGDSFTGE